MNDQDFFIRHQHALNTQGFTLINDVYDKDGIRQIIGLIEAADPTKNTFRISPQLFAIRQFLKEIPQVIPLVFNDKLKAIIHHILGPGYFPVKSIYFDKPSDSNWFVAYHQDLTISVDKKMDVAGFGPWTVKQNQFAVQPPSSILNNMITTRIHLDVANSQNGALKVLAGSHLQGIVRASERGLNKETEVLCNIEQGGIMLMKPLLMHASGKSTSGSRRRVIHIEWANTELPEGLNWSEKLS